MCCADGLLFTLLRDGWYRFCPAAALKAAERGALGQQAEEGRRLGLQLCAAHPRALAGARTREVFATSVPGFLRVTQCPGSRRLFELDW